LVKNADILVENYRPQVKFRLKIDYETLKKINPRLIYCSVSGFGQTGPCADRAGFDQIAQGMSGLMSITGFPGSGPCRVGVAIGDSVAAMFATYGILAALLARKESGVGQFIETSLLEGLVALLGFQSGIYFGTGKTPPQLGNDHGTVAPYGTYRTQDGFINISAGHQKMWEKLCQILKLDALPNDPRFKTIPDRVQNKDALRILMEKVLLQKPVAEWVEILNQEGIPSGPILAIDQVFQDEQVLHQKMLLEVDHATAGKIKMIGFPVKMSETPCQVSLPPPAFGQHTHEILKGLNYTDEEITELKKNGII